MGQYWIPVNLDKKEFVHPHRLGSGLKLWEQLANSPGTGAALLILTAAYREMRGGGDPDLEENWHGPERVDMSGPGKMPDSYPEVAKRTWGRWAGDRIAIVGDYAKDSDLQQRFRASKIYEKTHPKKSHVVYNRKAERAMYRCADNAAEHAGLYAHEVIDEPAEFTDITEDVCRVIEHELQGVFEGEGWREFKQRS